MTLINPLALWLCLLLPIPSLLARRRKARRLVVSNLYLWQNLVRQDPARPALRRPRRDWLVALQTAFMAVVILALSRPAVAVRPTRAALILDVSASMGAKDGTRTRLDLARDRAQSVLDRLPRRSRVELIAAGATPRDLGDYAAGDPALARALEALAPTAGGGNLSAAISLAAVGGANGADVSVITDRARDAAATWDTVGHAADNLALTRLAARRLPLRPSEGELLVEVRNYGARPRDTEVEITQDGQLLAREAVHVDGEGRQTTVLHSARLGHMISARLLGDDALAIDNHRFTVVPALERVGVTLVGGGTGFLEKALAVNPGISLQRDLPGIARRDVIVCNGCQTVPEARRGVLMIPPSDGPLDGRADGTSGPGVLTIARPAHPLAASLDLGEVRVTPLSSRILDDGFHDGLDGGGDVVLRAGGRPVVIAYERDGRRVVELRFDTGLSALTAGTAFPILIANAIDWLAARNENPREIVSGDPLRWILPEVRSARDVSVTGPDGLERRAQLMGGRLTITDTDVPGPYRVRTPSVEDVFVVNPAVDTESDLRQAGLDLSPETVPNVPPQKQEQQQGQRQTAPLLLLGAAALLAAEWWWRGGRAHWRRVLIAGCLILAAAGLAVPTREGPVAAIVALDRSGSVPPREQNRALDRVNAFASTMRSRDRLGVVAFGASAALETRPAERVHLTAINSTVGDTATDISAALRLARRALPPGGSRRIVLISDGEETMGDAQKEAAYAAADGVRVDVVEPDAQERRRPLAASRVVAPSDVQVGEPFVISVEVAGSSGARGHVSVYRDDQLFGTTDVIAPSIGTTNATFSDRHRLPGLHTYRAHVESNEEDFSDQASGAPAETGLGAIVSVSGEPTVLYVSSSGGSLPASLAGAGYRLTTIAPESMAATPGGLAAYDEVVLDDVPSERLSGRQTSALVAYVEEMGGGLLLLGSSRSLSLAGYPAGPLGRILPVDLRPRAGVRAPSLGLVLVFDKSGSMADLAGGTPKIELARQAVMKVLDVLPSTDSLGLIAFDAAPVVIAPLAPSHDPRTIAERLRAIAPGGSTLIAPAMELATRWLHASSGATVSRRHILLISDGRSSPDDATRLRASVGTAGVELSVVAIGPDADRDLLTALAVSTGGRAYFPANVADLPLIVAREAVRAAAGTVVEERFVIRGADHPILAGIDRLSLPQLGGYVVSAAKPTAASVLASHLDDPILTVWRAGIGRVGVFTGDLDSTWSAPLRAWIGAGRLWGQTVRWLSRRTNDHSLRIAVVEGDNDARVSVETENPNGGFIELADPRVAVRLPTGATREIALSASAPGRYEARLATPGSGPYVLSVTGRDRESGAEHRVVRGFFWSAERERRFQRPDIVLLHRLAEMTGGRMLGPMDGPFVGVRQRARRDMSTWLATAALGMFVLDIAMWWEFDFRRLQGWFRSPRRLARERMAA